MSEQEPTWAEMMNEISLSPTGREFVKRHRERLRAMTDEQFQQACQRWDLVLYTTPKQSGEEDIPSDVDARDIHAAECHRIRDAMPTTYETSRNMGYWGNDVLEKHRQCCALQSWYDPKKQMYRWFRPEDGWRKP